MANRSRSRRRGGESRRRFLFRIGAGGAVLTGMAAAARESGAFTSVTGDRTSAVDIAPEGEGIVGIVPHGPVKKNDQEPITELTNNAAEAITFTVSLDTCSDGTLYDNAGGSGCSVTFSLAAGNTQFVDIDADVTGFIGYSISASSSSLSLSTTGTVESQSGNVTGAVDIRKPNKDQDFAIRDANQFELDDVDIRDADDDDDLDRIEFTVREGGSSGTIVGSLVEDNPPGDRYAPSGTPAVIIEPNDGYTIKSGTKYTLTVKAEDVDGNSDIETIEDTTEGTQTPTPTPTDTSNDPPTADFTMTAAGGNKVDVDASASTDDGSIVSYEWWINNTAATGSPDDTGVTATLNPVKNGDTITLVVTDDAGATDKLTKTWNG